MPRDFELSESNDPSLAATVDLAIDAHERLDDALAAALRQGTLDARAPSMLPDWTVGHVLTHIARNADSHVEMLLGEAQYGGSRDRRNADIERGAARDTAEIVEDVAASSRRLVDAWRDASWDGTALIITGAEVSRNALPLLRTREVEVHRADLGVDGYSFADWPGEYVRRDLRVLQMAYTSRLPMGLTGMPTPVLEVPPATRLAWLLGRVDIDGAPGAGGF